MWLGRFRAICLALCISVLTAGVASAASYEFPGPGGSFLDGNDLHLWCQSNKSLAQAYTAGLWDLSVRSAFIIKALTPIGQTHNSEVDLQLDWLGRFCEPDRVILEQVIDVYCAYLRDVPETRQKPAAILFSEAMTKAWPCKKP